MYLLGAGRIKSMVKRVAALLLIMVIALSALAGADSDVLAADYAYRALASAIAAYCSDPPVGLQGVSFSGSGEVLPSSVSFVRSDISTYQSAFQFFSDSLFYGQVLDLVGGAWELAPGSVIIDGTVRIDGIESLMEIESGVDDWTGAELSLAASVIVDGSLFSSAVIVEARFLVEGGEARTIRVVNEDLLINGIEYSLEDAVYSLDMIRR